MALERRSFVLLGLLTAVATAACATTTDDEASSHGEAQTRVEGERFRSLETTADRLAGVFVRDADALAFDVRLKDGRSTLRLSTTDGAVLFESLDLAEGRTLRLGPSFRSFVPREAIPTSTTDDAADATPAGMTMEGDFEAAIEGLRATPLRILPNLSAALGRAGLTGSASRVALLVHLTAMGYARSFGFELAADVVGATNASVARVGSPRAELDRVEPEFVACEDCGGGGTGGGGGACGGVTKGAGKGGSHCTNGRSRLHWDECIEKDPCDDKCVGLCGSGCTPWTWVCGADHAFHLCWDHDRYYCRGASWWDVPGKAAWAVCKVAYSLWSAAVATEAAVGGCNLGTKLYAPRVGQVAGPW